MRHRPLRIGLLSYRSHPYCGGQGVYIRNLSHALCKLGHQVEVISGPPYPELDNGARLHRLPSLDLYNPDDLFRTPSPRELIDPVNLLEWLGVSTMGSLGSVLNDVLRTMGIPVSLKNVEMNL